MKIAYLIVGILNIVMMVLLLASNPGRVDNALSLLNLVAALYSFDRVVTYNHDRLD